ncbi:hypothetical protein ABPG72_001529 [Tetrahymena utriculariae]
MSLVIHNISYSIKNWIFLSIAFLVPISIIPLAFERFQDHFISIITISFINIVLTFILEYIKEMQNMMAYDQEFKLRQQLEEWKDLIEGYIPNEILIVSKVPQMPLKNGKAQNIKLSKHNKEFKNTLSKLIIQDSGVPNKLDQNSTNLKFLNEAQKFNEQNCRQKITKNLNGKKNDQENYLLFQQKMIPSTQKNFNQSLFPDIQQESSLANIQELEKNYNEQLKQQHLMLQQNIQISNQNQNPSIFSKSFDQPQNNFIQTKTICQKCKQFGHEEEQEEFNNNNYYQNNNDNKMFLDANLHQKYLNKFDHLKIADELNQQTAKSNQSNTNIIHFENTSFNNSEYSKRTMSNNYFINQKNLLNINQGNKEQNQLYSQLLKKRINAMQSQQSNHSKKNNNNNYLDPQVCSIPQSTRRTNQPNNSKENHSQKHESTSLENNDMEIINNYKEMIRLANQQHQINFNNNLKHQSFNIINNQKPTQWSTIIQNKKMSFNSFNQLSQQGSISFNIYQNAQQNSQNNLESYHTRSPSNNIDYNNLNTNEVQKQNNNQQNQNGLSIFLCQVISEKIISDDKNQNLNQVKNDKIVQKTQYSNYKSIHEVNKFNQENLNKTIHATTSQMSDHNIQSLEESQKQDQNKSQQHIAETPLNKKQHFVEELMSVQNTGQPIIFEETPTQRNTANYDLQTLNDNQEPLITKQIQLISQNDNNQTNQAAPLRQKSQTMQGSFGIQKQNSQVEKFTNKNIKTQKTQQKVKELLYNEKHEQNGKSIQEQQVRNKKISIQVKDDDSYCDNKISNYNITFPQLNQKFAASFGNEDNQIKIRLQNITKDNISVYDKISEYFSSTDSTNKKNIFQFQGTQSNFSKLKETQKRNFENAKQNSEPQNTKTQDGIQKESHFELLGCYDQISKKYYDIKIIPVFFEDQNASLMIYFNDISFQVMNQRLQSTQKYKDLMLASISHDLRTPLNFIKLMIEKCEEEDSLKMIKVILPMIKSNCELLMSLINDILDHQQMQEGKFRLVTSEFSVNALFDEVQLLFKIQSEEKSIKIIRNIAPNIIINSDKNRLKQILINLMSNAIKFTQKGQIKISAHLANDSNILSLSVKDSGCGIPQNLQEKLFQVYSTFDHSGGTNKHGVGLGLSLCRGLVSQLGPYNKIDLVSKQGKGSKFSFKIWANLEDQQKNQIKLSLNIDKIFNDSAENNSFDDEKDDNNDLDKIHEVQDDDQQSSLKSSEKINSSTIKNQLQFEEIPDNRQNLNSTPDSRVRCYTSVSSQKFAERGQDILQVSVRKNSQNQPHNNLKSTFQKQSVVPSLQQKNDLQTQELKNLLSHFSKLLIVDDTIFNIIALKIWLKNFQIQIDTANDGREAFQKYQKAQYDLILMDIQMPIMDGYQSTKLIRQYEQQNNLPRSLILIVSAFTSQDDVNKCINVGADDHISKPIERPIFCQILKKHLKTNNNIFE